ncbi:MAG: hypothetical protein AAGA91_18980 [Pseudomonadota bacterium]
MTARFTQPSEHLEQRLVRHITAGNLLALPASSAGPSDPEEQLAQLADHGVVAIQHPLPDLMPSSSLAIAGMGRVDKPEEADSLAAQHKQAGYLLTTLHVGSGFETDNEIDALVGAIIDASDKHGYPMFIETHRATVTQDVKRTLDIVQRFPDVRFNADLSHWYTGQEMVYGDWEAKLDLMAPVFERVRYMHGRLGTPCCMQVAVRGSQDEREFVEHHRELWRRCMRGFLATATPGEVLPFAPELLPYRLRLGKSEHLFYYARELDDAGEEESDRWQQAMVLYEIADACWQDSVRTMV